MKQEDVAKALGLSKTTVSRALSGKGRVGKATRDRVNEYMETVNREERMKLSFGPTKNLCVVIPGDRYISGNTYFSECLYGICESASTMDYNVFVIKGTENDISEIVKVVEERKADGIILTRSLENDRALSFLCGIDYPVGVAGHTDFENAISVDIDNKAAANELTSLLISKGFKNFALVVDDLNFKVNKSRYEGMSDAIKQWDTNKEKQFIYTGRFTPELLERLSDNIINDKTECIICGDDEITVKIMSGLTNEGFRIPRDVAVASCANSPTLNALTPTVTAVDVPARMVGAELGKQMICCLEGRPYNRETLLDYEILIRKSTNRV